MERNFTIFSPSYGKKDEVFGGPVGALWPQALFTFATSGAKFLSSRKTRQARLNNKITGGRNIYFLI